jgi:hypothetical protein
MLAQLSAVLRESWCLSAQSTVELKINVSRVRKVFVPAASHVTVCLPLATYSHELGPAAPHSANGAKARALRGHGRRHGAIALNLLLGRFEVWAWMDQRSHPVLVGEVLPERPRLLAYHGWHQPHCYPPLCSPSLRGLPFASSATLACPCGRRGRACRLSCCRKSRCCAGWQTRSRMPSAAACARCSSIRPKPTRSSSSCTTGTHSGHSIS